MKKKTILIFEDDPNVFYIFSLVLEDLGYQVEHSNTSDEVIEKTLKYKPDLILMDNWIPKIGGVEAIRLLKKDPKLKDIPVILISANSSIHELANKAGANGYLAKPFDLDQLEQKVGEYIV